MNTDVYRQGSELKQLRTENSRLTSGLRKLAENIEWIRTHGLERISQTRDLKELNAFHQGRADAAESMQAFWRDYEKTHGALIPEATKEVPE